MSELPHIDEVRAIIRRHDDEVVAEALAQAAMMTSRVDLTKAIGRAHLAVLHRRVQQAHAELERAALPAHEPGPGASPTQYREHYESIDRHHAAAETYRRASVRYREALEAYAEE